MKSFRLAIATFVLTASLAVSNVGWAQEALPPEDWVLTRVADKDVVIASVPFSNGITLLT